MFTPCLYQKRFLALFYWEDERQKVFHCLTLFVLGTIQLHQKMKAQAQLIRARHTLSTPARPLP
jgi:hypothetical protein